MFVERWVSSSALFTLSQAAWQCCYLAHRWYHFRPSSLLLKWCHFCSHQEKLTYIPTNFDAFLPINMNWGYKNTGHLEICSICNLDFIYYKFHYICLALDYKFPHGKFQNLAIHFNRRPWNKWSLSIQQSIYNRTSSFK